MITIHNPDGSVFCKGYNKEERYRLKIKKNYEKVKKKKEKIEEEKLERKRRPKKDKIEHVIFHGKAVVEFK